MQEPDPARTPQEPGGGPSDPVSGADQAPGAVSYSIAPGTILHAGNGQVLTVTVAATANYNAATMSVLINVQKATPTITWSEPARIPCPAQAVALPRGDRRARLRHPGRRQGDRAAGALAPADAQA